MQGPTDKIEPNLDPQDETSYETEEVSDEEAVDNLALPYQSYLNHEFVSVVDKMIALEPLFRLSMERNNALQDYLLQNPDDLKILHQFSGEIRHCLGMEDGADIQQVMADPRSGMSRFVNAFQNLLPSRGYSMMRFLQKEIPLGLFLDDEIQTLVPIYNRFKSFMQDAPIRPKRALACSMNPDLPKKARKSRLSQSA